MSVISENNRLRDLMGLLGRAVLHNIYPDEFEYYSLAFELLDKDGKTVAYLLFPVMPDGTNFSELGLSNVKQSAGGMVSLNNPKFAPKDFTFMGTFGRPFKIVKTEKSSLIGSSFSSVAKGFEIIQPLTSNFSAITKGKFSFTEFSKDIKTGYGTCQLLYKMFQLARVGDVDGNPYYWFMYNLTFNANYLVEPVNISVSQDVGSNNGWWRYNFAVKATAPAKEFKQASELRGKSLKKVLSGSLVTRGLNTAANVVRDYRRTKLGV